LGSAVKVGARVSTTFHSPTKLPGFTLTHSASKVILPLLSGALAAFRPNRSVGALIGPSPEIDLVRIRHNLPAIFYHLIS